MRENEQWHAYFTVHGDPSVVTDPARPAFTEVCKVSKSPDDYGLARTLLIAAAPELLEALRDFLAMASGGEKSCGHEFHCVCTYEKAKDAMKKATGR